MNVETISQKNITVAIGESISFPASQAPRTRGKSHSIADNAVIATGTALSREPWMMIFSSIYPCSFARCL